MQQELEEEAEHGFKSNSNDEDDYNQDSSTASYLEKQFVASLRGANSPSPIRKHGSLLDLFNATNNDASR